MITYPEQYGLYRVQIRYEDEIHRIHAKGNDLLSFFNGRHWKIHPDWYKNNITQFFLFFKDRNVDIKNDHDEGSSSSPFKHISTIFFLNKHF